ncbi:hypothetical protein [Ensifer aridi]|uniref:hypothetical protein n=1 Tax=Ensifer aridi TaxID=1708715 RepID=UPI00358E6A76
MKDKKLKEAFSSFVSYNNSMLIDREEKVLSKNCAKIAVDAIWKLMERSQLTFSECCSEIENKKGLEKDLRKIYRFYYKHKGWGLKAKLGAQKAPSLLHIDAVKAKGQAGRPSTHLIQLTAKLIPDVFNKYCNPNTKFSVNKQTYGNGKEYISIGYEFTRLVFAPIGDNIKEESIRTAYSKSLQKEISHME